MTFTPQSVVSGQTKPRTMIYITITYGKYAVLMSSKAREVLRAALVKQLFKMAVGLFAVEHKSPIYLVFQQGDMPHPDTLSMEIKISSSKNVFRVELEPFIKKCLTIVRTELSRYSKYDSQKTQIPVWVFHNKEFFLYEEKK